MRKEKMNNENIQFLKSYESTALHSQRKTAKCKISDSGTISGESAIHSIQSRENVT